MGIFDTLTGIAKAIGIGFAIWTLVVAVFAFGLGYQMSGRVISVTEEYASGVSSENSDLHAQILTITGQYDQMKLDLEYYKKISQDTTARADGLSAENSELRARILSLEWERDNLKRDLDFEKFKANTANQTSNISPVTPVQTEQITTPAGAVYTPSFNYGSWSGRPTYPSIQYYTTVTNNIMKFTEGKTFEQVVNGIRSLKYISHANDNSNYAIQYADETLVKGGGDCTDKCLLLYACLKAQGYDEDKMAVASISDCEGVYNHNVLAMEDPPFDTSGVDSQSVFVLGGRTWYVVDPTNWAGTPVWQMMDYYKDCYRVGNMHFYWTDNLPEQKRLRGWDEVPIHGLKVSR